MGDSDLRCVVVRLGASPLDGSLVPLVGAAPLIGALSLLLLPRFPSFLVEYSSSRCWRSSLFGKVVGGSVFLYGGGFDGVVAWVHSSSVGKYGSVLSGYLLSVSSHF